MSDYTYFAFLDVLGYKNYLKKDIENSSLEFKDKLESAFSVFHSINAVELQHKSVSDSIFLYSSNENPKGFLENIKKIYTSFIDNGLLLRGGVSYNRHFENSSITYSLALTEAYQLESEQAIFPRVMIHDSVVQKLKNESLAGKNNYYQEIISSSLLIKDGSMVMLNILDDANWDLVYRGCQLIYNSNKIEIDRDGRVRVKHVWLQDYILRFKPSRLNKKNRREYIQPLEILQ